MQLTSKQIWLAVLIPVILLLTLGLLAFWQFSPPRLEVNYINVGQGNVVGDSILLQSSEGKVVLIDGGEIGTGALQYLKSRNISHIDTIILTHPHEDHFGGLIDVIRTIPVDEVVTNSQVVDVNDVPLYKEFLDAVSDSNTRVVTVKARDKIPFGRLSFNVLSPRKINPDSWNNNSLVLRLTVGKVVFLFTGDTAELEESRLVASGVDLKADILKVAHHGAGSSSSPAFLVEVQPAVAIYSSGVPNRYGFPELKTLENLRAVGAKVYGTDKNGTISVTTDGWTYKITPERGGPLEH